MTIVASDEALATQTPPRVRTHPETGRKARLCSRANTIGLEGLAEDEANLHLGALYGDQAADAVTHRHRWAPGMVVLWDNRCLLHAATGGYEGHRRELHRLTIAER
jgi:taurine dioxygenase